MIAMCAKFFRSQAQESQLSLNLANVGFNTLEEHEANSQDRGRWTQALSEEITTRSNCGWSDWEAATCFEDVNRTEPVLLYQRKKSHSSAQFDWILSSNDVFLSYPFGLLP
jgi:hypothetical protein